MKAIHVSRPIYRLRKLCHKYVRIPLPLPINTGGNSIPMTQLCNRIVITEIDVNEYRYQGVMWIHLKFLQS